MIPRDAFLERVRQAVIEGNRAGATPALPERGNTGYQGAGKDPVERFRTELVAAGGFFHSAPNATAAIQIVLDQVRAHSARRILLSGGSVIDQIPLPDALLAHGAEVGRMGDDSREMVFAADMGISGVDYLVAETGTVVMTSAANQPRSVSLLPPVHLALAHRSQILPDLFDLLTPQRWPQGLPACLTLITGPSKTGDIELRLVTGVHGPGTIHVIVLDKL